MPTARVTSSPAVPVMRAGILAIASLMLCTTRAVAFPCPQSDFYFQCSVCQNTTSTTPTGTMNFFSCTVVPWQAGQPCPSACYDIPHGRIEAHWTSGGTSFCSNAVAARDTLRLAGPPGPAVSFEEVLLVQCTVQDSGSALAGLSTPGGPFHVYSTDTNEELVRPLSIVPGEAFEVFYAVNASNSSPCCTSGNGGAHITADLRFRGLPAGYSLYSCRGFFAPVPAAPTSWGRMKAAYR
jgi:hypothetical protein